MLFLAVVGLVWKRETALVQVEHVLTGIVCIGTDVTSKEASDSLVAEGSHKRCEFVVARYCSQTCELVSDGGETCLVGSILIHKYSV